MKFIKQNNLNAQIRNFLPFIGLIAIVLFFQFVSDGRLLTVRNASSLTNEIFNILIGACGLAFLLSQNCIDFSLGANVAVSCAFAARAAAINPLLALPVGLGVGLLIGLVNGILHAKFRVNAFFATLAVSFVLRGFVFIVLEGGSLGAPFSMLKWDSVNLRFGVMVIIVIIGYFIFEKSRLGKQCKAIGSNIEAARQSGINVNKIKIAGFMIVGALAGLVAFFGLIHSATASSSTGLGFEVNALNALLIGGMPLTGGATARFRSAIIGSIMMAVISNGMTMWGLDISIQQVVRGVIFLFAISLTLDRKNLAVIK